MAQKCRRERPFYTSRCCRSGRFQERVHFSIFMVLLECLPSCNCLRSWWEGSEREWKVSSICFARRKWTELRLEWIKKKLGCNSTSACKRVLGKNTRVVGTTLPHWPMGAGASWSIRATFGRPFAILYDQDQEAKAEWTCSFILPFSVLTRSSCTCSLSTLAPFPLLSVIRELRRRKKRNEIKEQRRKARLKKKKGSKGISCSLKLLIPASVSLEDGRTDTPFTSTTILLFWTTGCYPCFEWVGNEHLGIRFIACLKRLATLTSPAPPGMMRSFTIFFFSCIPVFN